jgi:hypothetical protein
MSLLVLPDSGTILVLTPLSGSGALQLTPWSARGLTQTFEVISGAGGGGGGWLRRDVNGYLRSVADSRFRKYKSSIQCRDGTTPCLDDAWIGITCDVSCVFELNYPVGGHPARPVVPGSERTVEGTVIYYRPMLTCLVSNIKVSMAEWPATYDWTVDLEEV